MYFQCDPGEDVDEWRDDRIWEELQARVGANGYTLKEGPITSKTVLPFRSFVQEPMRHGNLLLAGDAAHTVPPTAPRGSTSRSPTSACSPRSSSGRSASRTRSPLDDYATRALDRVWKAQHFSYWMTTMLHRLPDASAFDVRRQVGELRAGRVDAPARRTSPRPTPAGPRVSPRPADVSDTRNHGQIGSNGHAMAVNDTAHRAHPLATRQPR